MNKWKTSGGCVVAVVLGLVFTTSTELKTSEDGLKHIADYEGCMAEAYQCSADKWTVGLGHTKGVNEGDVASYRDMADWFIDDVQQAERVVDRLLAMNVSQPQYDMAVSFVFNLGAGNFVRSTFLKKLNADDETACDELTRWVYVNGKDCRVATNNCAGIVKRRQSEREICLNGYSAQNLRTSSTGATAGRRIY